MACSSTNTNQTDEIKINLSSSQCQSTTPSTSAHSAPRDSTAKGAIPKQSNRLPLPSSNKANPLPSTSYANPPPSDSNSDKLQLPSSNKRKKNRYYQPKKNGNQDENNLKPMMPKNRRLARRYRKKNNANVSNKLVNENLNESLANATANLHQQSSSNEKCIKENEIETIQVSTEDCLKIANLLIDLDNKKESSPIGSNSPVQGANSSVVGAISSVVDANSSPIGANSSPIGANSSVVGAKSPVMAVIYPNSSVVGAYSPVIYPNSSVVGAKSPVIYPNSSVVRAKSPVIYPNSSVVREKSPLIYPNSSVVRAKSPLIYPNSSVAGAQSPVIYPNSSVVGAKSPVIYPNSSVVRAKSPLIYPNSSVAGAKSPVIYPNCSVANANLSVASANSSVVGANSSVAGANPPLLRAESNNSSNANLLTELLTLEDSSGILSNFDEFTCSICMNTFKPGKECILRNCCHMFCKKCLAIQIELNKNVEMKCPDPHCDEILQHREIKSLVTNKVFETFLNISVKKMDTYFEILDIETNQNIFENFEKFECSICFTEINIGDGCILQNCLHTFCKVCLANHIKFTENVEVLCPYSDNGCSCVFPIRQTELRSIASKEIFENHLLKEIKVFENQTEKAYHCKKPNCPGWWILDEDDNEMDFDNQYNDNYDYDDYNDFDDNENVYVQQCPVCLSVNCLICNEIHYGLTCKQFQNGLDINFSYEGRQSLEVLREMVLMNFAMPCPTCKVIIQKDEDGCDWLQCYICKTEICWATRGPRWGPKGKGDLSGGCRCDMTKRKCHVDCRNCH